MSIIPNFILITPSSPLSDACLRAIRQHFPDESNSPISVIQGRLDEVDPQRLRCDCLVSPANSFAIMDGGFDAELSHIFKGTGGLWHLTDHCQSYVRDHWHGYIPPGSCTIVPLPSNVVGKANPYDAHTLAILPTMRTPEDVSWHLDLVYNAIWSLLVQLEHWNKSSGNPKIRIVLMTGIGTGTGRVPVDRCAQQIVLALKHFQMPLADCIRWNDVEQRAKEVRGTIVFP